MVDGSQRLFLGSDLNRACITFRDQPIWEMGVYAGDHLSIQFVLHSAKHDSHKRPDEQKGEVVGLQSGRGVLLMDNKLSEILA